MPHPTVPDKPETDTALELQHAEFHVDLPRGVVVIRQKRSRFALHPDEITVPFQPVLALAGAVLTALYNPTGVAAVAPPATHPRPN